MSTTTNTKTQDEAADVDSPRDRLVAALVRYHNRIDSLLAEPADADERPADAGLPPHLAAGGLLAAEIQDESGMVLDQAPQVASRWEGEFDSLQARLYGLIDRYRAGDDGVAASLGRASGVAQQAARLAQRLKNFQPTATKTVDASAPVTAAAGPAPPALRPAHQRAITACAEATRRNPALAGASQKEVWNWIRDNDDDYHPPSLETFRRYVRAAREAERGGPRNTSRRGRTHGPSIVKPDQI